MAEAATVKNAISEDAAVRYPIQQILDESGTERAALPGLHDDEIVRLFRHMVRTRTFDENALKENIAAFLQAIVRAKPAGAKGTYLEACSISATMSPSVKVDTKEFVKG